MVPKNQVNLRRIVVLGFSLLIISHVSEERSCFPKSNGSLCSAVERRFMSINGKTLNITLQVSERISHKLATTVLEIILREKLGYEDITTISEPYGLDLPQLITSQLSGMNSDTPRIPPALVNLQVMVPTEFDESFFRNEETKGTVFNYGSLAPPTRLGWYIWRPLSKQSIMLDYLRTAENAIYFSIDDTIFENFTKRGNTESYFCEYSFCTQSVFIPNQCRVKTCATLITTFPSETKFVVQQILQLQLFVKVVWVGENIGKVLHKVHNSSVLFMDWSPTHTEMINGTFSRINLMPCEVSDTLSCQYEQFKVTKYGWVQLERYAEHAHRAILYTKFDMKQYNQLLELFTQNARNDVFEASCEWVKQNEETVNKWIWKKKEEILISGIFPFTGSSYNGFGIAAASDMATEAINKDPNILSKYSLRLHKDDGECNVDKVMKIFIHFTYHKHFDKLLGTVGPACSETLEPLVGVSEFYKTAVVSYSAEGMSFSDRKKYPFFFRTIGENRQYKHVYHHLFKHFGWKRVAALTEDGQKRTEYISYMGNFLVKNGIEFISNTKFPKDDQNSSLTLHLDDLKHKRARIIIADVDESTARALMCVAYKLGMTARAGYVWFLPAWLPTMWYNASLYNDKFNETVPCSLKEMEAAIEGYFSVAHAPYADDTAMMQENRTVYDWRYDYEKECLNRWPTWENSYRLSNPYFPLNPEDVISPYAGFAYDAVWTYAYALDRLLRNYPAAISDLHHEKYFNVLIQYMQDTDFNGVSGNIKFYGGASRFSDILIMQWQKKDVVIGAFHPNVSEATSDIVGGELALNDSMIKWFTEEGFLPNDGTVTCTFQILADTFNTDCKQAFVAFNIIIFSLLAVMLVALFFYCKRKFEKKYEKVINMKLNELPLKVASLDKWEIAREKVVINRKLGMGAFGTVYGGHALFFEDRGWTAVAVKTLKVGSTTEEKLDFLSEAEAMKRFDHKNIVKLLAVITKTEPVCTVMELMLYGDLKNYLLGRRHIVNQRDEESEEVSSKKLTSMALDVARALSYLADLKYVHRDVACRNCLVNSHRVVKLGDFGMTRSIYENEYYRFSKKGLLPVRWMAPESLVLGIFPQASDIWSFGVLLYEIITFGSLPYQGFTNNEVLEQIKKGKTITLPTGIKPQLEGLIKACWNPSYKSRPQASEIAEFLANNPRLLSPCLDMPLESMDLDDSAQWRLLPESGKVAVGLLHGKPKILARDQSAAALSTSAQLAHSMSTNLTYVSTDLSLAEQPKNDYHIDLIDDEKALFL